MHDAPRVIDDEKLLPCPFCGGKADMEISEPHTHTFATFMPDSPGYVLVSCNGCAAAVITDGNDIDAGREAWNRRTAGRRTTAST